jgi:predicted CXXCH cytochrome family protein
MLRGHAEFAQVNRRFLARQVYILSGKVFMLLFAAAVFIGSQACRPCHPAIAESYAQTPMARSSGRVDSIVLPAATFSAVGTSYRIGDGQLNFGIAGAEVKASMDYFIGSGAAGRSFLVMRERYLFELPVTWYSRRKIWDASPGYEHEMEVRLNRAVEPSCLFCHSSRVQPIFGTQNRYGDPPFLENGVSCERCHGPGSEHARNPAKTSMINPATLEPELRDSVCNQCHLTGDARIERPGRRMAEFQAGQRLSDFATYFVRNDTRDNLKVTSHVERLAASKCKQVSGDKLWCGTCHDPHASDTSKVTDVKTQAACTACHPASHHRNENCAECHMPKSPVVDGGHGVLTDHGISFPKEGSRASGSRDLIAYIGTADERALGLAYAELGDPRARRHLLHATPADPEVRLRLASLENDDARAAALYESVLRATPFQPVALVNLGSIYAKAGRTDEAGRLWERALSTNPGIEAAVLNLAQIRPAAEASEILLGYLRLNPGSREAAARLKKLP